MATLKVVVRKRAWLFIQKTADWYLYNMGKKASHHFVEGVMSTIDTLSQMPTIGIHDERRSTEKRKYYTFLTHPNHRILYYYTNKHLYIVAIRATKMNNSMP